MIWHCPIINDLEKTNILVVRYFTYISVNLISFICQIYFQDMSLQPELKLPSKPCSPIIDPHLSPDGTMLAYVRDYELHVLNLLCNKSKQLTFGADDNVLVSFSFTFPYILAGLLSSCLHIRYYQQHYKVQIETKAYSMRPCPMR